jgi:aspartate racemase
LLLVWRKGVQAGGENVKRAGMIGGIGPESTAVYYRLMVAEYRKAKPDGSYPSIFINSIDMKKLLALIMAGNLKDIAEYLLQEVEKLAVAGATFGFLTANSPHIVYDELQRQSSIPLISIVKAACAAARKNGFTRLGLLGARFTMQGRFYPEVFAHEGMEIVTPNQDEQNYIHDKYLGELVHGLVVPETREQLLSIMQRLQKQERIEAVILGGTELPLLFQEDMAGGIPLLDTTKIHVQEIVKLLLE